MIVLDRLLAGGLKFVLDKIATVVDAELDNPETLREELLNAQLRLETGEIDDHEFRRVEEEVMARLRELRGGEETHRPVSFGAEVSGVDVTWDADVDAGPGREEEGR